MKPDFFILADAASAADGKVYIHGGGLHDFNVPVIPWTQPTLAFVFRLALEPDEVKRSYEIGVQVVDGGDGHIIVGPATALIDPATFPPLEKGQSRHKVLVALTISGIRFPAVGPYVAQVVVDGDVIAKERLTVRLGEASPEFMLLEADGS